MLIETLEQQLNKSSEWQIIKEIFEIGKYEQLKKLNNLSYKLCLSFVVQATQVTITSRHFIPALAVTVAWLLKNNQLPLVVYPHLKPLFETLKVHPTHSLEDL
jgi:hypothetical protein